MADTAVLRQQTLVDKPELPKAFLSAADDSVTEDESQSTSCEVDKTPDTLIVLMGEGAPHDRHDEEEEDDDDALAPLPRKSIMTASTEAPSLWSDVDMEEGDNHDDAFGDEKGGDEGQQNGAAHELEAEPSTSSSALPMDTDTNASQAEVKRLSSSSMKQANHPHSPAGLVSFSLETSSCDAPVSSDVAETTDGSNCKQERRRSSVRFASIVMNDVDVETLQEKIKESENEKPWWDRQLDMFERWRLEDQVSEQLQLLHEAHGQKTLLHDVPDDCEAAKKLTTKCYPSPTGQGLSVSVNFRKNDSLSFYTAMKSFSAFKDITRDNNFQLAPMDWHVVITDVKGSTKAIDEGRYKDVNTIGAASISVVLKLLEDDIPFVFGGDGATLLIPPSDIGRVLEALLRLQRLSEQHFNLGLRVGTISVEEVHKAGGRIEVAKHELTAGRCVAVFRGGGLTVAEACIKGQEEKYCLQWKQSSEDIELEGLSCRWNAIPNKRGKVMSLLVCARDGESSAAIYDHVLQELDKIYDGKLDEANPVNTELMYYKTVGQLFEEEKRFHTNSWSSTFFGRVAEIFLAVGIFKYDLDPKMFDQKHYFESMRPHADHRKFDDMLRMILDCSDEQAEAIENLMDELHMDRKLHYGIHLSDTALMTCFLEDVVDGQHIHFIDGGDGGYAMAAKQLKAQLKSDLWSG